MKHIKEAVLAVSSQWVQSFNRADVEACVQGYTQEAIMRAKPHGEFQGRDAIRAFWKPVVESGAGELVYHSPKVEVLDEKTAILSSDWSMNVGSGVITKELWCLQDDGKWRLVEEDFEVLKTN